MSNISLHSVLNEMVSNITEAGRNWSDGINTAEIMRNVRDQKEAERVAKSLENSDKLEAQRMLNPQAAQEEFSRKKALRDMEGLDAEREKNIAARMTPGEKLDAYTQMAGQYVKNAGDWYDDTKESIRNGLTRLNTGIDIAQDNAYQADLMGNATLGQKLLNASGGAVDWAQEHPYLAGGAALSAALASGAGALALRRKLAAQKRG